MPDNSLAARLARARQLAGLTQEDAATRLSIRRPSISEMESGKRQVKSEELKALAELYGASISWLATGDTESGLEPQIEMMARSLSKLKSRDLEKLRLIIEMLNESNDSKPASKTSSD